MKFLNARLYALILLGCWFIVNSVLLLISADKIKRETDADKTRKNGDLLISIGAVTIGLITLYVLYNMFIEYRMLGSLRRALTFNIQKMIYPFPYTIVLYVIPFIIQFITAVLSLNNGRKLKANEKLENPTTMANLMIALGIISMIFVAITSGFEIYGNINRPNIIF